MLLQGCAPLPGAPCGADDAGIAMAMPTSAALVRARRLLIFTCPPGTGGGPCWGRTWVGRPFLLARGCSCRAARTRVPCAPMSGSLTVASGARLGALSVVVPPDQPVHR